MQPGAIPSAVDAISAVTGRYPRKVLWPRIAREIGEHPDVDRLRECYLSWYARGYNPGNLAWLLEWYKEGGPPSRTRAPRREGGTYEQPTQHENFARWAEYQQRVHGGEDPERVRRDLGL